MNLPITTYINGILYLITVYQFYAKLPKKFISLLGFPHNIMKPLLFGFFNLVAK